MEELIQQLVDKTGLDANQVKSVVEGVANFLGDKLPDPIGSQIKSMLGDDDGGDSGDDGGGGILDQAKDMLGGFLGND